MLNERQGWPTLSPVGEVGRPDVVTFAGSRGYDRIFSGSLMKRSPVRAQRSGRVDRFFYRSCLEKIDFDAARGFDLSTVLYPPGLRLLAWDVFIDRVGRVFSAVSRDRGSLELTYQGGGFRSKDEWKLTVGKDMPDGQFQLYFRKARAMSRGRVTVAGTVGFGLWDALWMSFDLERAVEMLYNDPDFVKSVFEHWKSFHLKAVEAMLEAGIKLVFIREHPHGFPPGGSIARRLDSMVGEHFRALSKSVRSRGGCIFLDCDADDMIETDYPEQWGFDGIGPMLFRDGEDLIAARKGLSDNLLLVGSTATPYFRGSLTELAGRFRRIILADKADDTYEPSYAPPGRQKLADPSCVNGDVCFSS